MKDAGKETKVTSKEMDGWAANQVHFQQVSRWFINLQKTASKHLQIQLQSRAHQR